METTERIYYKDKLLAFVVRRNYIPRNGIDFLTDSLAIQQVGAMKHPSGHIIQNHIHNPVARTVHGTPEAVFVRSGKVEVELFSEKKEAVAMVVLSVGDIIFLVAGGHGFKMLEESILLEIKQGPYFGHDNDKELF